MINNASFHVKLVVYNFSGSHKSDSDDDLTSLNEVFHDHYNKMDIHLLWHYNIPGQVHFYLFNAFDITFLYLFSVQSLPIVYTIQYKYNSLSMLSLLTTFFLKLNK